MTSSDQKINDKAFLSGGKIKIRLKEYRLGTFLFFLFFLLVPFDNYIGTVVPFPVLTVIYALFILVGFFDILKSNLLNVKIDAISIFLIFSCCSILYATVKAGISYNNFLFLQMLIFYFVFKNRSILQKEFLALVNVTPFIMVLFIFLNLFYIRRTDIGIYAGLKSIVDPNYLVTNMALVLTLFCFSLHTERKRLFKIIKFVIMALYFGVIAIIGSRGGLLTSIFIIAVYWTTQSKKPMKSFCIFALLLIVAILLAVLFLPNYILERFTIQNMIGGGGSGRLTIWKNYLKLYSEQNFFGILFGIGKNLGGEAYLEFGRIYYAHNMYIRALLETGLIGFLVFVGVIWALLHRAYKEKNAIIFVAVCGLVIGGMFLDMDNMRIFWLILAFSHIQIKEGKLTVWKGKMLVG